MEKIEDTLEQFDTIVDECKKLFMKKMQDYGPSWTVLRMPSITDQIFIKIQRIRSIEEKGKQKIEEGIESEFKGILNYSVIALIQLHRLKNENLEPSHEEIETLYDTLIEEIKSLLEKKNHDYGEAWREIRISSITDLMLQKIMRIKQIEDNEGKVLVSEGVDAGYQDLVNYSVFALIRLSENK